VPSYLVESYLAGSPAAVDEACRRARDAEDLPAGVRYVHTTFLPEDETVLHLFAAPSAEELARAAQRAALAHHRILEAVERR
jgi:hypothetical protein